MNPLRVFFAVAAMIGGIVMLVAQVIAILPSVYVYFRASFPGVVFGVVLLAGGSTYLWKLTGFRGLRPK